jgi:hypothetical protein
MSGSVSAKSCPRCGTVCPTSAPSCIRCAFPFPSAATPNALPVKRILSVLGALLLVGFVILVGILHQFVTSTGAYTQAIALARSASEVQNLLGDDTRAHGPAIGFASSSKGSQFTEFSVRLVGSRTGGHPNGLANTVNGVWEFSHSSFHADRMTSEGESPLADKSGSNLWSELRGATSGSPIASAPAMMGTPLRFSAAATFWLNAASRFNGMPSLWLLPPGLARGGHQEINGGVADQRIASGGIARWQDRSIWRVSNSAPYRCPIRGRCSGTDSPVSPSRQPASRRNA